MNRTQFSGDRSGHESGPHFSDIFMWTLLFWDEESTPEVCKSISVCEHCSRAPLRAIACQPACGITSTCPETAERSSSRVKDDVSSPLLVPNPVVGFLACWGPGLATDCWLQFHLSAARGRRSSASLGMMCGQYVKPPAVVDFLDWDYHFKSIVTQIPHDTRLLGIKPGSTACKAMTLPLMDVLKNSKCFVSKF